MADNSEVLLKILLDKAAQQDVEDGISAIGKELGKLDDTQLHKLSLELESIEKGTEELEQRFTSARQEAERFNTISEKLARNSTALFVAGSAIVGGIALASQNYVNFVEKAGIQGDETAERWVAASKRVKNAQLNLGQKSAEALLPVFEKAAELAEKTAAFIDRNPEAIQAALNTGLVVATLGAVGLAVSKGIRLYADFKYLAATTEYNLATLRFEKSVREFLSGQFLGGKTAVAQGGGALAAAGRIATIATLAVGELILATTATNALLDAVGAPRLQEMLQAQLHFWQNIGRVLSGDIKLNDLAAESVKLAEASRDARNGVEELNSGLRDFQQEADLSRATDAFIQFRQQETEAERQYMQQRADVVKQGAAQLAQIEANYQQQRVGLARQYAISAAAALSNFNFQQSQAAAQFARSEAEAIKQHGQQRAKARQEFELQEERSREDHLKQMRQLEEEHQDRVVDLVAARDALGLVREKRDYERKVRDAEEEYRTERARRQQDFKKQQQDAEQNFQQERARARQEFEFRQQQAAEQFAYQQEQAKKQYEERLKQLDEQHKQELEKARKQNAEKLREIDQAYRQEQINRRNAFFDILRDLNANLLNEQTLRNQYYARMQADLIKFLENTVKAGSNLPKYETHQAGGYGPGYVGRGEFVASRSTTSALEKMLGGRLTQQNLLAVGDSKSITVQLAFPGGLVTKKQMMDALDSNTRNLLMDLTRGIA